MGKHEEQKMTSAYLNALREEGTREELLREVERLYDENLQLRSVLERLKAENKQGIGPAVKSDWQLNENEND
jgi:hypothetical protein